jgi:hypothetical protein
MLLAQKGKPAKGSPFPFKAGFQSSLEIWNISPRRKDLGFLFPETVSLNKGWEQTTPGGMPVPLPQGPQVTSPMSDREAADTLGELLGQMTALNSNLTEVLKTA